MPSRYVTSPVRIGLAGLGAAGLAFLPALRSHPGMRLTALAEPDADTRNAIADLQGVEAHADIASLLARPDIDAVCIATPTHLHADHVIATLNAGKHVIVEKPMAVTIGDASRMVAAAAAAGLTLLVGHSHSYDPPVQKMRELIAGGSLGRVRMIHNWCFTDWIYRPRQSAELEGALGGGVTYRQGSHQFDIIRLLGGGLVRNVRARTFDWDAGRRATGAHVVFLEFIDGAAATAVYNGYGGFDTKELLDGVSEWGFETAKSLPPVLRRPFQEDESAAKRNRARETNRTNAPFQPHFGLTVVSCERGDIRQSPQGLLLYDAEGRHEIALSSGITPHDVVVSEFHDAVTGHAAAVHDGRWGLANLEICAAAIHSSETGDAVTLEHQIVLPS